MKLRELPELAALRCGSGLVRIPPELDVPLTPRIRRLVDTAPFRRLAQVSQLGLVSLVYPAANHTRFEHSLGVYRLALLFLDRLAEDSRFAAVVGPRDAERFLVAALLHDIGHWPFCHPIEDLALAGLPEHEELARHYLEGEELAAALREDWPIEPAEIVALLTGTRDDPAGRLLGSLLSGPIDVDKMDYLMRDSLHAGVPYGRNFDQSRLVQSLCLNEAGDGLAITDKGKTAAEMMVFSRYVMFSEVYWHHAVRSATAMLQRAFFELSGAGLASGQAEILGDGAKKHIVSSEISTHRPQKYPFDKALALESLFRLADAPMIESLRQTAGYGPAGELLGGLFGEHRRLYKRVAQLSLFQQPQLFERLAQRPYSELVECSRQISKQLSEQFGKQVEPHEVLVDAPPVKLEVEFQIEVHFPKEGCYRPLGDISPVVRTLAREQFDHYVKRVRVFVHPRLAAEVKSLTDFSELLSDATA